MPVRTALAALAALLVLATIVPEVPSSEPEIAGGDGGGESRAAVAVDREGPRGDTQGRLRGNGGPPGTSGPGASHAAMLANHGDDESDERRADAADPAQDEDGDHLSTDGEPQAIYGYDVEVRGEVAGDTDEFEATIERILTDARGWTLGGSLAFERTGEAPDLTVVLATPDEVAATHEVCSHDYSCRVEDEILINDRNWREATPAWHEADGDLTAYRRYLVNHEVGHFLGFGHVECGGDGELAPVMQQQSVSMQECEPNGWPLDWEREELAQQLGIAVRR